MLIRQAQRVLNTSEQKIKQVLEESVSEDSPLAPAPDNGEQP